MLAEFPAGEYLAMPLHGDQVVGASQIEVHKVRCLSTSRQVVFIEGGWWAAVLILADQ
jgi:hypothetical protein